ncbi:MAG: hypothetical protein WBW88_07020 [Rhodothermales bacterium]
MSLPPASIEDLLPEIARHVGAATDSKRELVEASGVLSTLRNQLIRQIDALLTHRRELLMSVLYRVDVRESLVIDAFQNVPLEELASRLADLIIERQVEKVRSRRAFRDNTSE